MNSSGWIRGIMSKNYENEAYLLFVGQVMENQLKEWEKNYAVNIMKLADYHFVVKNEETYYETVITENELKHLQDTSPYSLDAVIWRGLEQDGLEIIKGFGNYLDKVGI